MDAEDLLLRQFLGIRTERQTAGAAKWIRSRQRDDGTWATYYGGPPDLSTTIEAYVALRLAGDAVDDPHMRRASTYIREAGGIGASRVFTRIWLALFGQWPWERLPGHAARAHAAPAVGSPEHLRLRVLGPSDGGRPHRDQRAPARARPLDRHRRAGRGSGSGAAPVAHLVGRAVRPPRPVPPRLRAATAGRPAPVLARAAPSAGSSSARRRTVRGGASSRRGSTRSWPCTCRATPWTTR